MSRLHERATFPVDVRIAWLENDADAFEKTLRDELKTVREDVKAMRSTLRWQNGIGVAILVSIIGALAAVAFK